VSSKTLARVSHTQRRAKGVRSPRQCCVQLPKRRPHSMYSTNQPDKSPTKGTPNGTRHRSKHEAAFDLPGRLPSRTRMLRPSGNATCIKKPASYSRIPGHQIAIRHRRQDQALAAMQPIQHPAHHDCDASETLRPQSFHGDNRWGKRTAIRIEPGTNDIVLSPLTPDLHRRDAGKGKQEGRDHNRRPRMLGIRRRHSPHPP
jgi:hypothetical protein